MPKLCLAKKSGFGDSSLKHLETLKGSVIQSKVLRASTSTSFSLYSGLTALLHLECSCPSRTYSNSSRFLLEDLAIGVAALQVQFSSDHTFNAAKQDE